MVVATNDAPRVTTAHKQRLIGLDLLRVLAAAWVGLHHLGFCVWAEQDGYGQLFGLHLGDPRLLSSLAACGWVGVEVFFVLSGLVIAYSAEASTPYRFVRSRFLRLMPALWICSVLVAVVQVAAGLPLGRTLAVLLTTVVAAPFGPYISKVYWTLSVEIIFYATVFALLFSARPRRLDWYAYILGSVSTLSWTVYVLASPLSTLPPLVARIVHSLGHSAYTERALLQHGCFFAVGILLWSLRANGRSVVKCGFLVLFLATCLVQVAARSRQLIDYLEVPGTPRDALLGFAIVTTGTVLATVFQAEVSAFFSPKIQRIITSAGLASYPFYLVHETVGLVSMRWSTRYVGSPRVLVCIGLAVSALVAVGVSTFLEPRLRTLIASWWTAPMSSEQRAVAVEQPRASAAVSSTRRI